MKNTTTPAPCLGIREAAKELGVGYNTARKLVLGGHIPHIRIGRRYRIERNNFEAYKRGEL